MLNPPFPDQPEEERILDFDRSLHLLQDQRIANGYLWLLAFAPILGGSIEALVWMAYSGENPLSEYFSYDREFWLITYFLHVALSRWDNRNVARAGYDVRRLEAWIWLPLVYIIKRYLKTRQGLAPVIIWFSWLLIPLLLFSLLELYPELFE